LRFLLVITFFSFLIFGLFAKNVLPLLFLEKR